jgi:hypothetical protein
MIIALEIAGLVALYLAGVFTPKYVRKFLLWLLSKLDTPTDGLKVEQIKA